GNVRRLELPMLPSRSFFLSALSAACLAFVAGCPEKANQAEDRSLDRQGAYAASLLNGDSLLTEHRRLSRLHAEASGRAGLSPSDGESHYRISSSLGNGRVELLLSDSEGSSDYVLHFNLPELPANPEALRAEATSGGYHLE